MAVIDPAEPRPLWDFRLAQHAATAVSHQQSGVAGPSTKGVIDRNPPTKDPHK